MKVCLILVAVVATCVAQPPPGWHPSGRALLLPTRIQEESTTPAPNNTQSDEKESERILDSGEYYVLLEDGKLQMVKYTTAALKEQDDKQAKNQKPQQSQQNQQYQQASKTLYPVYQQAQYYQQPQQSQQNQQYQQASKTLYPVYQQAQYYQQPQQSQQNQQYQQASKTQYPVYQQAQNSQQKVNPEPSAQFQLEYVQYPLPGSQFTQTKLQYTSPETDPKPDATEKEVDTKETTGYEAKVQYRDVKPISAPIYAYNPTPLVRILKK